MTLTHPAGPPRGSALIRSQIKRVGPDLVFTIPESAMEKTPENIEIEEPLKVYALGLSDVAEGEQPLDRARHVAWRYLLRRRGSRTPLPKSFRIPPGTSVSPTSTAARWFRGPWRQ